MPSHQESLRQAGERGAHDREHELGGPHRVVRDVLKLTARNRLGHRALAEAPQMNRAEEPRGERQHHDREGQQPANTSSRQRERAE